MVTTIRFHHDSDGITSAYLTSFGVKNAKLDGWDGAFGDTTGLKAGDWMVDMRPKHNMMNLNVIDHHLPHPKDRKYNLIYDRPEPASLQCWEYFKDYIPKEEWWKVVIGIVGDGQPELIPPQVFESCPMLLTNWKTSMYQNYGKWKVNYFPMYKLMSSGINAILRRHDFETAIQVMKYVKTPDQLLNDSRIAKAKAQVSAEFKRIQDNCKSYELPLVNVFVYESQYRMTGYIASTMGGATDKTTIAINSLDQSGSLRGDLAEYIKYKTRDLDYLTLDGHSGFMGMKVRVDPEVFVNDLIKVL